MNFLIIVLALIPSLTLFGIAAFGLIEEGGTLRHVALLLILGIVFFIPAALLIFSNIKTKEAFRGLPSPQGEAGKMKKKRHAEIIAYVSLLAIGALVGAILYNMLKITPKYVQLYGCLGIPLSVPLQLYVNLSLLVKAELSSGLTLLSIVFLIFTIFTIKSKNKRIAVSLNLFAVGMLLLFALASNIIVKDYFYKYLNIAYDFRAFPRAKRAEFMRAVKNELRKEEVSCSDLKKAMEQFR